VAEKPDLTGRELLGELNARCSTAQTRRPPPGTDMPSGTSA